jgi:deoxycytidine triphosphate deaminase
MQLTGKQIVENGIVYNYDEKNAVQQQGVDVRLMKVSKVSDSDIGVDMGYVPANGKTCTPHTEEVMPIGGLWTLSPGYYEVEFKEGCKLPDVTAMYFKTRSSLVRCGAIIHSGQFDAGFETDKMGAFLHVIYPIQIEQGARVAQAVVTESYPVDKDNMYNGQWQNDNQRNGK